MSVDNYLLHKLSKDELIKIIEYQNRPLYLVYNANGNGYHARDIDIDIDICLCNNKIDATKKLLEMSKKAFDDEWEFIGPDFDWEACDYSEEYGEEIHTRETKIWTTFWGDKQTHPLGKILLKGFTLDELSNFKADMLHKIFSTDEEIIDFIKKFLL